jgi:hypothetical protein
MQTSTRFAFRGSIVLLVFVWLYLAFVTQPIMVHDAKGYEDLGRMIAQQGWKSYFVSGPNREPVYPFLIAGTMKISAMDFIFGASEQRSPQKYLFLLKLFQFFLLFLSVMMSWSILKNSGVTFAVTLPAIFYLGVSPALVNSALSVYSEIATYVSILGIVVIGSIALIELQKESCKISLWWGLAFSGAFIAATLVKSIYEVMLYLCLIPFLFVLLRVRKERNQRIVRNFAVFIFTVFFSFQAAICGYKYLNKTYNGLFVLTDRAAWAFYGTAARREVPLTVQGFGAAVAYKLFEEEGCRVFYSPEACHAWDIRTADQFSSQKNYEVIAKFPPQKQNGELLNAALAKIMENPLQYAILMSLDWVRLFFWESTRIGFVAYPDWLDAVFDHRVFAVALRMIVGIVSFCSFMFCLIYLFARRKIENQFFNTAMLFSVTIIFWHFTMYSFFFTLPRFALPVAPLFVILMAFSLQILIRTRKEN